METLGLTVHGKWNLNECEEEHSELDERLEIFQKREAGDRRVRKYKEDEDWKEQEEQAVTEMMYFEEWICNKLDKIYFPLENQKTSEHSIQCPTKNTDRGDK